MSPVYAVYAKELTDILRDRRTIISMIVVPMLVIPLIMLGFGTVAGKLVQDAMAQAPEVMVLGAKDSPKVRAALEADKKLKLVPETPDHAKRIGDKALRAAVEIPDDFDARLAAADGTVMVKIYHYEGELRSGFAANALEKFFRDYRDRALAGRLAEHGLPVQFARPLETRRQNVAPPEKVGGNIVGSILPYVIILLCFTGAMYPALDLTAGEKERGTMETILSSPVRRGQLVLGKFLVVLTASLAAAGFSVASMTGMYLLTKGGFGIAKEMPLGDFTIAPAAVLAVIGMLVPLAILFSAVLVSVGTFARSFKEAQSYAGPMVMVVVLPAMGAFLPGVDLTWKLALVPILNVSLASKEVFTGTYPWAMLAVIFLSTCVYAAIACAFVTRMFNREEILFRT